MRCVKFAIMKEKQCWKRNEIRREEIFCCTSTICMYIVKLKSSYCLSRTGCRRRHFFFLFYLITNQSLVCNAEILLSFKKKSKNSQPHLTQWSWRAKNVKQSAWANKQTNKCFILSKNILSQSNYPSLSAAMGDLGCEFNNPKNVKRLIWISLYI